MEKKSNGGLIAIIIILLIALLGVCFYVAYDKGLIFNNDSESTEDEKEKNESTDSEITNIIVKDKLDELVENFNDVAFHPGWNEQGHSVYEKTTLSDSSKLLVALYDLYSASQFKKTYVTGNNGYNLDEATYTVIDLETVKVKYKELFNEELSNYVNVGICPTFNYDTEKNEYRAYLECGGTGYDTYTSYNNKYTEDENNMYVYVNVGRYASKDVIGTDGKTVLGADLYADVTKEKLYKSDIVDRNDVVIDSSNYTEFSEYKYTFGKDNDGRLYYKSIERLR